MGQGDYAVVWLSDKGPESARWVPEDSFTPDAIEKRLIQGVRWSQEDIPVSAKYVQIIHNKNLRIVGTSRWQNAILVEGDVKTLYGLTFVDYIRELPAETRKGNFNQAVLPEAAKLSGINSAFIQSSLRLPKTDGAGIKIAVFDTGFEGVDTLAAFQGINIDFKYNFLDENVSVFENGTHGTAVLSQMAGNSGLVYGMAPNASYSLFVTENVNSERLIEEFYWSMAAEKCDSLGVDIINSSLSYTRFDDAAESHDFDELNGFTTLVAKAANLASERGIIVVVSAGNMGLSPWKRIGSPGDASKALTVGALNYSDTAGFIPALFSSFGPNAAMEEKPEVSAPGESVPFINSFGEVKYGNGTSFSAPIITGAIASVLSSLPNKSFNVPLIKDALVQSASTFPVFNTQAGFGMPNMAIFASKVKAEMEQLSKLEFSVFPVPNQGKFSIFPRADRVELFSSNLQELELNSGESNFIFSTPSPLSKGVYLLKIYRGGKVAVQSIVID
ncbi:MAG: serine protease AprX [Luteibaculaceae bacterium]|jgi:serine protease AprX